MIRWTGLPNATVDAIVAATAIRQPGAVLLVTSDPGDLNRLMAHRRDIAVLSV
jgi:hypothetical protein